MNSGAWIPPISFRIRESAENFDQNLKLASFNGGTFEVIREDGLKDIIYSEEGNRPLWVQEPNGRWRIFKYYSGEEISNYAHAFYSRLGMSALFVRLAQLNCVLSEHERKSVSRSTHRQGPPPQGAGASGVLVGRSFLAFELGYRFSSDDLLDGWI